MRWIIRLVILAVVIGLAGLWITRPKSDGPEVFSGLTADPEHGEWVFTAAGCASCHMDDHASGEDKLVLTGGQPFASPFGTFYAPNISMDPDVGIGSWEAVDLWNALHHGTSPKGRHYYPVLPYGAYVHLEPQDVLDLFAFMQTLPEDDTPSLAHDIPFPFSIRTGLGGWKLLFFKDDWVLENADTPELERGRLIVEGLGHCAECHTPRNPLGGLKTGAEWLSGAPNPAGRGSFPDLTPPELDWSEADLVEYFTSGFTPEFDSAGGHMALVVENMSALPVEDRQAVVAYLKTLPLE